MTSRSILHVDLDAFFCSVEEILDPSLNGKAFVVGGRPDGRGVVASASYAARAFGIRSAMPTAQALRLAPGLIILSSRHGVYRQHSKKVMDHLRKSAPIIQQISIDEAFLDVSAAQGSGEDLARQWQDEIKDLFQLPTSWGIATNKLVAKIATEVGKPGGLVVVPPGEEATFLANLPVEMLWGVGPKTKSRLEKINIYTIGELAQVPAEKLRSKFGVVGLELASRARGEDTSEVRQGGEPRSMSAERTFARDLSRSSDLQKALLQMSEEVGRRLRGDGLAGRTIRLKIRWPDFETQTRQLKLDQPTDHDGEIYFEAQKLLTSLWKEGQPVRLLGVGVADLSTPWRQLSLFEGTWEQEERLQSALDDIRSRFGPKAVRRAGGLRKRDRKNENDEEKR
jgi:DNA polymerase-4